MTEMQDFTIFFLNAFAEFLWSEPIRPLYGLLLLGLIVKVFFRLTNIN